MEDISNNIKKVMTIFLVCFVCLMSYIIYIFVFRGENIALSVYNNRLWTDRKQVLRGSIFDRNMNVLVKSKGIKNKDQQLEYMEGETCAHVLGYMDSIYGLTGLQKLYDKELMGKRKGLFGFEKKYNSRVGLNIQTTLDIKLQNKAFNLLGNNKGAVVVLNPKTGEILALVSKPSYDPNNLRKDWDKLRKDKNFPLLNRAVSGMYAPGSTFKIITTVCALENIKGIQNEVFDDTGKLVFNSKESLKNYNGEVLGKIKLKDAFVHSSNVVFGSLGVKLGGKKLEETAEKFYFNKDIPADGIIIDNSRFPKLQSSGNGDIAQSAIGQGKILATPIEMALVAASIANDGVMMKPMLVRTVFDNNGKIIKSMIPGRVDRVTTPQNAAIVRGYMSDVVKEGTGKTANVKGIEVCGKTGTAEHDDIPNVVEPPHSWFVGFAPYNNPKIAFAVIVEDGGVGGGKAAYIARELIKEYLVK
ncbi:penicillin-binding protein A [Clostridium tepidiprofundi DSM 19306]|uniref:Penicillin-binding protein A n=1 Tax=Clostridium tepidiprofundi DSM 19306 TaxID=1121338 RepID=A0A151B689_9CLOT|nr:penicillin-binding transpeptidase domain-containing protein [Clostridium tepidiprofundi]KYH35409.1 penicillin-binding protein A [Clostridium tepidiprofundi DSM 19306]